MQAIRRRSPSQIKSFKKQKGTTMFMKRNRHWYIIFLACCALALTGCGKSEEETELPPMTLQEMMGKKALDDLPDEQRNAILYGNGSPSDSAGAMANLSRKGQLQDAAAYIEYLNRVEASQKH